MKRIVLVTVLIGCAVPVDERASAVSGELVSHDSTWFHIEYYPWGNKTEAPPPDCVAAGMPVGCYASHANIEGVPDYIADLGVFLDDAHDRLQLHYNLPTSGRMDVKVHAFEHSGFVYADGRMAINRFLGYEDTPWSFSEMLRQVAWHEVFHIVQHRAFDGTAHPWANFELARRHRTILESTATEDSLAIQPFQGTHYFVNSALLLDFPLVIPNGELPDLRQYASFIFFRYMKSRGIDLVRRWFGEPSPQLTIANAPPTAPIETFFNNQLRAVMPSLDARRDLFRDFALAYQFTRDNAVIPGVRELLSDAPTRTTELTGYERKDPGTDDAPPLAVPNTVGDGKVQTILRAGTMATHAIGIAKVLCTEAGPSCNPEAVPVPEVAKLVVKIRLHDVDGAAGIPHYGAVWRVRGATTPVRLSTFAGSDVERELEYDLAELRRRDKIVVTVVYDPEVMPSTTKGRLEVTAAFDNACRSKKIVVDHPDSQVDYYGGAGYLFTTEPGCKKMLVKIWGGGGGQITSLDNTIQGDGGGGAFVGARIPIDPIGEPLRATVPFSQLTGTSMGAVSFVYQPAVGAQPPTVLALAGGGGQGGRGWGLTAAVRPHAGGAHESAEVAVWTSSTGTFVMVGGSGATATMGGQGAPHNTPFGDGSPFLTSHILDRPYRSYGPGACAQGGAGGAGWFGGGGGDAPPWEWTGGSCGYPNLRIGSGGGGGSSFVIASRLGQPVTSSKVGGARRTPGNVDDPDRTTPVAPGTTCQGGASAEGDPGRGRLATNPAWCGNPGRIVIKFGKAATTDTSVGP